MGCPVLSATALALVLGFDDTVTIASEHLADVPSLHFSTSQSGSSKLDSSPTATLSVRETQLRGVLPLSRTAVQDAYTWKAALLHRYRTVTFETLTPRADFNGDVHQLGVGLHGWRTTNKRRRTLSAMPVISTSSNALKSPHSLASDDMFLWLSWMDYRKHTLSTNWLYGLRVDDRFGQYRVYPTVGGTWEMHPGTFVQLAYPDTRWRQHIAPQVCLDIGLSPDGGRWRVHNKTMEKQNYFRWKNWRARLGLIWSHPSGMTIELSAGIRLHQHMQIPLEDGSVLETGLEDTSFATVDAGWHWR